jgi:hypothetical protein
LGFALLLAVLAVGARLPFLISGKIAFDSDEAVEGLMARHVLHGEFPAFFWGQAFKGVPEVYAGAGAFAVAGPGVAVLKSVTLAFFAIFVALNFVLLDKTASRWLAVAASLLLIVAPPALVFWSLDASAEYILLMLLGTLFLLLCLRWQEARSPIVLGAIGLVTGIGFWTHLLFVIYLIPSALIVLLGSEWWRRRGLEGFAREVVTARGHAPAVRFLALILSTVAATYFLLATVAFLTGGFSLHFGSVTLGARSPQKMLRIAVGVGALAVILSVLQNSSRAAAWQFVARRWPLAAGFLTGYSPVLLYSMLVEPAHSPSDVADLQHLLNASPDIFGNVVPILAGFKMATTERLPLPLMAVVPGLAALIAFLWSSRRKLATDFFPIFVVFVPALYLVSGAYRDTQSYRYLIPLYAGLAVAWAGGSLWLARGNKTIAALLVAAILAIHAWQQAVWYRKLAPDTASAAMIACLRREGFRGGYADYWLSYKLTFLSKEELIIAPTNGVDRYPAYTEFVRSLPADARADDATHCN